MAQMQALLKIKADVEGEGKINSLGRAIGGLSSTAGRVSGGLRGLSGALGSMASLAAGAGLMALAKNAIDTADNLRDMSIRTGVSVEQLSKLKTAAEMSGATIEDVGKGLAKTAIAIGNSTSAASNATATAVAGGTAKLKTSIADQLRILEQADARKVTTIKTGAERQIQAVRDGEQRQVEAIERAKDQRIAALERESDQRMREINRRYRQEEKLLNDSFDDQRDAERRKTDENLNRLEREINRRYELQQKQVQDNETLGANAKDAAVQALRDQQDAELATLRQGFTDRAKAQDRNYRDQQEAAQQAIDDRRAAEQAAEQAATDARKKQADDSAKAEKAIMAKASADRIAQIKAMADAQVKAVEDGNKKAQDAYARLGIALRNQDGSQRKAGEVFMDVFDALAKLPTEADRAAAAFDLFGGKLATKLLPLFAMTREEVEKLVPIFTTEFANSADSLNDAEVKMSGSLLRLGAAIGNVLLPLTAILEAFTQLPGPLQTIIGSIVLLAPAILIVANVIKGLMALKIFATIAGWAGVLQGLVPILFGLKTAFLIAFQGILAFLQSSFIPAIAAFFSGPVGWTVLAVAAVVAMAILFRKPLQDFAGWLVSWGKPISQFFVNLWDGVVKLTSNAMESAKSVVVGLGVVIKGAFNFILRGVFNSVNGAINNINFLINRANALSAKVRGPQLPTLPTLSVPQFAKGGYVSQETLAKVGEAEPEYIVPERKAAAFAMNYLNGARGGAAIPAFASGGFVGGGSASGGFVGGNAQINVTTGPVMQQGGQQYVSMADMERAMRATANGVYASLRTPAGRRAVGVR